MARLRAALAVQHAKAGRHIHPLHWMTREGICDCPKGVDCNHPGKHPLLSGWKTKATTDLEQVREWWKKWPDANIGCVLHDEWVIDFDAHRPEQALQHGEFWSRVGAPPATWRVRTPHRGLHVWFNSGESSGLFDEVVRILDGVELLGRGKNVLLAGSEIDGRMYQVEEDVPIASVPIRIVQLVRESLGTHENGSVHETPKSSLTEILQKGADEGARDVTATRLAGFLFRKGMNEDDVLAFMLQWNSTNRPPMDNDQVKKIVWSIGKAERGEGRLRIRTLDELERIKARERARALYSQELYGAWTPPSSIQVDQWLELDLPDPKWRVQDVMMEGANVLLAALYKSGKTTLILNLAKALCDSVPFLDRFEVQSPDGRIGYWNLELSELQFRRWVRECGIRRSDRMEIVNLRGRSVDIRNDDFRRWTIDWIRSREIQVLLLDPFAPVFRGDENSNTEVREFLSQLDQIRMEAGLGELVIAHHFGRAKEEAGYEHGRGATRLDDWADVRWILSREGRDRFFSAQGRDVEVPEGKLEYESANRQLRFVNGSRQEAREDKTVYSDEKLAIVAQTLAKIVASHPGTWTRQLATEKWTRGISKNRIAPALELAVQNGWIVRRIESLEGGHRQNLHRYYPKGDTDGSD